MFSKLDSFESSNEEFGSAECTRDRKREGEIYFRFNWPEKQERGRERETPVGWSWWAAEGRLKGRLKSTSSVLVEDNLLIQRPEERRRGGGGGKAGERREKERGSQRERLFISDLIPERRAAFEFIYFFAGSWPAPKRGRKRDKIKNPLIT